MSNEGQIYRISGPVVTAKGMSAAMYDVVRVGEEGLIAEPHGLVRVLRNIHKVTRAGVGGGTAKARTELLQSVR